MRYLCRICGELVDERNVVIRGESDRRYQSYYHIKCWKSLGDDEQNY